MADFINWAKNNGVPVGPGRGSGAGSLVAYALGITDLDPLRYNLLFERFLNPERVSMPDFDIDFCQHGRDRVIQYVKEKYGADAVSQIATFGTMAAKAAVRDIGRVLDLGYMFTDGVAKLIPFKPGKHVTIADAMKEEPLLQERYDNEDEVHQLLDLAQRVEGLTRNVGMHAGGVLIAPGKLTDFCPLYTQGDDGGVVSQYDKDDVEAVGLVKFDFLGLTTLTILDWAERYIRRLDPSKADWSLAQVPLDDPASFQILKKANTVAVFQLESRGMQGMLKDAQPDRFEDIIALVSLYRPGPMDLIPSFCARKHGREKVDYPDPRVEPVLKETYGIMVYQEQVMQMAQIIGGYSLGGADLLRRAMGKKKPEEMAKHREIFAEGAAKNGLTREKADEIFDLMEKFAGYGFNKSHAAAYALLAYHTAWLKAHHPAEFMAANMTLAMDDTDKVKILFDDCELNGLKVLPPDINQSEYRFEPVAEADGKRSRTIRYGLGAVKGSGQNAIEEILRARKEGGAFKDLFDFCERIDRRLVNRRTVEALIRAGAFDALTPNRAQLIASVPLAMEAADQAERQRDAGRPVRHGRRVAARACAGRRTGLGREAPPAGGKGRARFLPVGPPVRRLSRRSAPFRAAEGRRPEGRARQAGGRRDRLAAHADDAARQDADRAARRRHRPVRDHGLQRAVRGEQGAVQGRRTADRAGPGAQRRVHGRHPLHGRYGDGSRARAQPLRAGRAHDHERQCRRGRAASRAGAACGQGRTRAGRRGTGAGAVPRRARGTRWRPPRADADAEWAGRADPLQQRARAGRDAAGRCLARQAERYAAGRAARHLRRRHGGNRLLRHEIGPVR